MPIARTSVASQVAEALRARLASAEPGWQEGDRVPNEQALARQFEVGRSSIREAVRVLAHEGWLETRQGSGTFVLRGPRSTSGLSRLGRERVIEVFEARHGLEVEAARLAALRRTDGDLARITRCLRRRRDNERRERHAGFVDADIDFHSAVVAAAHNAVISDLFVTLAEALRGSLEVLSAYDMISSEAGAAHADLAAAIRRRDAEAAAVAARMQFSATEKRLLGPEWT